MTLHELQRSIQKAFSDYLVTVDEGINPQTFEKVWRVRLTNLEDLTAWELAFNANITQDKIPGIIKTFKSSLK